jgi:voltage-gated potassium channel Kch
MTRVVGTFALAVLTAYAPGTSAGQLKQKTYRSGEEAAQALFLAVQGGDEAELSRILGADKQLLAVGDTTQDDVERRQFVEKYRQMHRLAREPDGTILYLGAENWPFPVPLVSKSGAWSFDARAGKREILFRRIGTNESFAISVVHALARSEGGDADTSLGETKPLHGYYFRALEPPGKPASFIAYPAEYRSSGVMTFVVGHDDVVYERDLGSGTVRAARKMTGFTPGSEWQALPGP